MSQEAVIFFYLTTGRSIQGDSHRHVILFATTTFLTRLENEQSSLSLLLSSFHRPRLTAACCLGVYAACRAYQVHDPPTSVWVPGGNTSLLRELQYLFPFSD
jgi:hypothetical protein